MTRIALIVVAASSVALAAPTTSLYNDGDAGFNDLTLGGTLEQAVVESRIGNANPEAGIWEVGLWRFGAVGTPMDADGRGIDNGEVASFTLDYDGGTGLSFAIDGATVADANIGGTFTDIFIRLRGVANGTATLQNLALDGSALSVSTIDATNGVSYLRIQNVGSDFGAFSLTGEQVFDWTGTRPNNSALAVQFKLTNVIPTPGVGAVLGLAGLAATRRRR
ncbi:MAG: choice-of-anchor W domain-containing protein [Planctomycetota bacterium]